MIRIILIICVGTVWACSAWGQDSNSLVDKSRLLRKEIMREKFMPLNSPKGKTGEAVEKLAAELNTMHPKLIKAEVKEPALKKIIEAPAEVNAMPAAVKDPNKMDEGTLANIAAMAAKPESVSDPMALAGMLFECKEYKLAAIFYEIALEREMSQGRRLTIDDKAWMLLQVCQCRKDEPVEAVKALDKLLEQYPNSTWSRAAYVKKQMLQWKIEQVSGQ
ncbi:MAG: hypothetical protein A2Y07_05050 [Planctomycetes bacterium GWF2_50_10]|nr:MAG: hypothetical protein A2Y07_05050 [Planctomycetes bacterium GWF2_50_10]